MTSGRKRILVVDDVMINRAILSELFSNDYEVLEAENGLDAIKIIENNTDSLAIVLLDIIMPQMDGFGVLRFMNETKIIKTIPVVMITSEGDDEKALLGYGLGVSDLVHKPFNSDIIVRRIENIIDLYEHRHNLEKKLNEQKEMLENQARKLTELNQSVIDTLSTMVEFRDSESGEHVKRIRMLTHIILESVRDDYNLTAQDIELITIASAVHDIGKIAIPDSILLKPGPLTNEEFEIMKTHTTRGCEMLSSFGYMQDQDYYKYCYEICRHHHERWNGKGYPDGLKGNDISIWAQAASLADVYDALTSKRVYKDAFSHDKAIEMILGGECGVFNPKLLTHFGSAKVQRQLLDQLHSSHPDSTIS